MDSIRATIHQALATSAASVLGVDSATIHTNTRVVCRWQQGQLAGGTNPRFGFYTAYVTLLKDEWHASDQTLQLRCHRWGPHGAGA